MMCKRLLMLWMALAAWPMAAAGQAQTIAPAQESVRGWVTMLVLVVLLVGMAVAAFMSSKRGHRD